MTLQEIRKREQEIYEKYKDSEDTEAYYEEIGELYEQIEEPEDEAPELIMDLLKQHNVSLARLSQRSGYSVDDLERFNNPENMDLLTACKVGIGLKKCGIYADEITLLGTVRFDKLLKEHMQRAIDGKSNESDAEFDRLQFSVILGVNLAYKRVSKDMSCAKLSEATNISKRTLEKYETGEKDITKASVTTVYEIASALDCRIEDIIGREYLNGEDNKQ